MFAYFKTPAQCNYSLHNTRTFCAFFSLAILRGIALPLGGRGFQESAIFFFLLFFCKSSFDFALFISFHETRTFFFFASVAAWIRVKRLPPCVTARIATSCVQKRHAVVWDAGTTKGFQMSRILSCVAEPHDLLCSHFLCSAVICRLASAERFLLCVYQPIPTDF